jgi:hypothetical protein
MPKGGVCRLTLTDLDKQGRDLIIRWAEAVMDTSVCAFEFLSLDSTMSLKWQWYRTYGWSAKPPKLNAMTQ